MLADPFLYFDEAELMQTLIKSGKGRPAKSSNSTFRYIDGASLNNSKFSDNIHDIKLKGKENGKTIMRASISYTLYD